MLLLLVPLLLVSLSSATTSSTHYRAAVIEFPPPHANHRSPEPLSPSAAQDVILANLDAASPLLANASSQRAEVAVLPEYGLTGVHFFTRASVEPFAVPVPSAFRSGSTRAVRNWSRCDDVSFPSLASPSLRVRVNASSELRVSEVLQRLACLAVTHRMVLAVNMITTPLTLAEYSRIMSSPRNASNPQERRFPMYNTELVFEVDGSLRVVYHKYRLFEAEAWWLDAAEPPTTLEEARAFLFNSSFGVEFAVEICFDSVWPEPQLLWPERVENIIFSTAWVAGNPYYVSNPSVIVESGTRLCHNFLAANIGAGRSSSGSGLFSCGREVAAIVHPYKMEAALVVADLPRSPRAAGLHAQLGAKRNESMERFPFYWPVCDDQAKRRRAELVQQARAQGDPRSKLPKNTSALAYFFGTPGSSYSVVAAAGSVICRAKVAVEQGNGERFVLQAFEGPSGHGWNLTSCVFERCQANDPSKCGASFWVDQSSVRGSLVMEMETYVADWSSGDDSVFVDPRPLVVGDALRTPPEGTLTVEFDTGVGLVQRMELSSDSGSGGASLLSGALYNAVFPSGGRTSLLCETL